MASNTAPQPESAKRAADTIDEALLGPNSNNNDNNTSNDYNATINDKWKPT